MEALAAVGLAGSMFKFPSCPGDAVQEPQIHASTLGSLKAHEGLEDLTTDLKDSRGQMQASAGPQDSVLKQLRSGRREVADELLKFGKSLSQRKIYKPQKGIVGIKWQRKTEDSGGKMG